MPDLTINNVDVSFPFVPYPCQEAYMGHVIRALQNKQNAILESPTGTGKTLCLLCSALAWRQTYLAQRQLQAARAGAHLEGLSAAVGGEQAGNAFMAIPTIIYASRTHSQISQVVKELRNTIYKPKVAVLGSRDQMCVHPKVKDMENSTAKIHTCRAKVKERSCVHYTQVEKKVSDAVFNEIMDIEELVQVARDKTMCPYYTSRELSRGADIMFMPYNYLIDGKTRKNQNISLENAIVIFDEAHNVEKVCEESFSFELTSMDIANCIENCQIVLQRVTDSDGEGAGGYASDETELTKADVLTMKGIFLSLEREFNKLSVTGEGGIIDKSTFKNLLLSINVNDETKGAVAEVLTKMEAVLSVSANSKVIGPTFQVLNNFMAILDITLGQTKNASMQYVCYVSKEKKDKRFSFGKEHKPQLESVAPSFYTKLSYWCFSPGLAMEEFQRQGVYSIILTSGTLSPISSFSSELKIPFPITLSNPHVIQPSQILVQVLTTGCGGAELTSTYQNRNNPAYLASLGNTIVNVLRQVPDGVLTFFPSYNVMNITLEHWKTKGIWERMEKLKSCFVEPKNKTEMMSMMTEFDSKVRAPEGSRTGAVLFAVCRGKASEGIDFADTHGRAVIITGMPYPPAKDPKVMAKRSYLDQQKRERPELITGHAWYQQQSMRAVNQAVGRVIRHSKDFGAVLFLEKRFSYRGNSGELPHWMQGSLQVFESVGKFIRPLNEFFKLHAPKPTIEPDSGTLYSAMRKEQLKAASGTFNNLPPVVRPALAEVDPSAETTPPPKKICRPRKRVSLLSSLSGADENDFETPASLTVTDTGRTEFKTPEVLKQPRKRIKLVSGRACSSDSIPEAPQQGSVSSVRQSSVSEKDRARQEITFYSAKLKTRLSGDEYARFKRIMADFKAAGDVGRLVDEVGKLFLPNHRDLLLGFRIFLKSRDHAIFDQMVAKRLKG